MTNKIQNQVAVQNEKALANGGKKTMQGYIKSMEGEIAKALPSVMTPERFTRMVLSAISTNPKLASCTPASFLGAMMNAAQLGLEPNTPLGQAYILPYQNKGTLEAQFQIGYKGLIDLAYRSGEVELVQAHIVYANDKFEVQLGLEPKLVHVPADKDRGEAIKVYAMFKTKSGGYGFEVMSMDAIRLHAEKYSKAYKSGFSPWATNFEEMAKKTVLKKCLKYAPLKSDFVRQAAQDMSVKTEIDEDMSFVPDNVFEAEYSEVIDADTGEIVENGEE
jgi:recombination protein RecT